MTCATAITIATPASIATAVLAIRSADVGPVLLHDENVLAWIQWWPPLAIIASTICAGDAAPWCPS